MKKILGWLTLATLLAMASVCIWAWATPAEYSVIRTASIRAPREAVFPWIADLSRWPEWSPWKARDGSVIFKPSERTTGPGAKLEWTSEQNSVGGFELVEVVPNERVVYRLFFDDWTSDSRGRIELRSLSPEETEVAWTMYGTHEFSARVFWIVFRFEKGIAEDFDQGLELLKARIEAK